MLSYEYVEDANDEQRDGIVAGESEHHNELWVVRSPFFRKWIAYFKRNVVAYIHRLKAERERVSCIMIVA